MRTTPVTMISIRANNLAMVNNVCTLEAIFTLNTLMAVSVARNTMGRRLYRYDRYPARKLNYNTDGLSSFMFGTYI